MTLSTYSVVTTTGNQQCDIAVAAGRVNGLTNAQPMRYCRYWLASVVQHIIHRRHVIVKLNGVATDNDTHNFFTNLFERPSVQCVRVGCLPREDFGRDGG
ncbi:hypothetical protein D3C78_1433960 [compost metagenome]